MKEVRIDLSDNPCTMDEDDLLDQVEDIENAIEALTDRLNFIGEVMDSRKTA